MEDMDANYYLILVNTSEIDYFNKIRESKLGFYNVKQLYEIMIQINGAKNWTPKNITTVC